MMNNSPLYLKPDVQLEPLVDRWYAWSHLIAPATAARNVTERHLAIMDSYIASPDLHATAARNPKLAGGPFIDYNGQRVDEIRDLRDRTKSHTALIELSSAIGALDALLLEEAKGYSVQNLYARVPDALRGYVELVYDLNNHPSFRLLEGLLYRSRYYDPSLQSFMISVTTGDSRPFVLSTPRLNGPSLYHWPVSFSDERVDPLFRSPTEGKPFDVICDLLNPQPGEIDLIQTFFTPACPPAYRRYEGLRARWRYFGHACVLVETPDVTILFDPVLSYTYECGISRYTYQDLPDTIDYVVITHNHQDHVLFETLLQIRHKVRHVVVPTGGGTLQDPSLKLLLRQIGFERVTALDPLDEIPIPDGAIIAVPFLGEHCDLDIATKSGYLVRVGRHSLLFLADSCNLEPTLYEHLHRGLGDVDALFVGMECVGAPLTWLYGPLLTHPVERAMSDSRRLNGSNYPQAAGIVGELNCKEVYVYAMGQEPWLNHVMSLKYTERSKPIVESNRLIEACRTRGLIAERLFGEREMFLDG
jgi:L-ascorbate metabolism protein UlaG (beta-lactamase superfamily)